jgi:hypothetical protein
VAKWNLQIGRSRSGVFDWKPAMKPSQGISSKTFPTRMPNREDSAWQRRSYVTIHQPMC